jgi:hypothetical protein
MDDTIKANMEMYKEMLKKRIKLMDFLTKVISLLLYYGTVSM